jgi:hypothetical protein
MRGACNGYILDGTLASGGDAQRWQSHDKLRQISTKHHSDSRQMASNHGPENVSAAIPGEPAFRPNRELTTCVPPRLSVGASAAPTHPCETTTQSVRHLAAKNL